MAKRHKLDPLDWGSVFGRLEELVMANSGEDAFSEIFKIIVAKLAQEQDAGDSPLLGNVPTESAQYLRSWLAYAERKWPQILNRDVVSKLSDEQVHICLTELERVSLHDAHFEVLDGLFEHLVTQTQKGAKGQFFTPRTVIEAIIRIIDPKFGEFIADPACGSGGFLTHAQQYLSCQFNGGAKPAENRVHGYDIDPKTVGIAKAMNLFIGENPSNIVRLNSLSMPSMGSTLFETNNVEDLLTIEDVERTRDNTEGRFDVIITNPPFAGEVSDPSLMDAYELAREGKRNERDVLFLERCVNMLKPNGRIAIVVPSGRTGAKQSAFVRNWLLSKMRIVSVLSLDRNTFRPHTTQKADVIFGVRRPERVSVEHYKDEEILFLTSESSGKDSRGNAKLAQGARRSLSWEGSEHDLDEAVSLFRKFVSDNEILWG